MFLKYFKINEIKTNQKANFSERYNSQSLLFKRLYEKKDTLKSVLYANSKVTSRKIIV